MIKVEDYCKHVLTPATTEEIVVAISGLLNHYAPPMNPTGMSTEMGAYIMKTRKKIQEDWLESVQEYPQWAIQEACKEWLHNEQGRFAPKIADIRKLCEEKVQPFREPLLRAHEMRRKTAKQQELEAHYAKERSERLQSLEKWKEHGEWKEEK